MASMGVEFSDDILAELLDSEFKDIATETLKRTAPVAEAAVVGALNQSTDRGHSTGAMARSIKTTRPTRTKTDAYLTVTRPTGRDAKGVRNMEKAMYLQYGTTKQASRPWLEKATKNAEAQVFEIAQDVLNKKTGAKG